MAAAATLAIFCLVWIGCASGPTRIGDRYFDSRRYVEAAAAYEQYLAEGVDKREERALILYRLGLIYARSESGIYDPGRSAVALRQSLEADPDSSFEMEAHLMLKLAETLSAYESEISSQRNRLDSLYSELSLLQEEIEQAEGRAGARERTVETLSAEIESLLRRIDDLTQEVETREEELERLKAIDLDSNH